MKRLNKEPFNSESERVLLLVFLAETLILIAF